MKKKRKLKQPYPNALNNDWIVSVVLMILYFVMPFLVNVKSLAIYESLFTSVNNNDQGLLVITSFKLVLMNSLRVLPVYMASFTLIEWLKKEHGHLDFQMMIVALALVPIMYKGIELSINIRYDFGFTSVIAMIALSVIARIDLSRINVFKKSIFVILFLIGLQWMDIIPILSAYGFGRGEVSYDIKSAIKFMGANDVVTFSALIFIVLFVLNASMIFKFLLDQNSVIKSMEEKNSMKIQMKELELQTLRSRSYEEMQFLVHDLKSPLTSIQALVSITEMISQDKKVQSYMYNISNSVDQLNGMISEILHENNRNKTKIDELFSSILSQMSPSSDSQSIIFNNDCKDGFITINKIRFSRMIINLLTNSISAFDKENSFIRINVYLNGDYFVIEITDNGKGISNEDLIKITERGFSTKGSTGIGLKYVETVITNHGGIFNIESTVGIGTRVSIEFEKGVIEYDQDIDY